MYKNINLSCTGDESKAHKLQCPDILEFLHVQMSERVKNAVGLPLFA